MNTLCRGFVFLAAMHLLGGCTYTNAVSLTNIPANRTKVVTASVKKNIFLGFNFDNDQVAKLVPALQEKCPDGDVKGVLTKDSSTFYFLFIFWARETEVSGYCIPRKAVADTNGSFTDGMEVSQWDEAGEAKQ
jgi:hypothetical protein